MEVSHQCSVCGGDHGGRVCPFKDTELKLRYKNKRESTEDEEIDKINGSPIVPLRKKTKRESTGKEDNFIKSYYRESQEIRKLQPHQIEHLRRQHGIEVEGDNCPAPITDFSQLSLPVEIVQQLQALGYHTPTAIQMQVLPCAMSGRDVIGIAETGSGKTLSYVLPLLALLKTKEPAEPGQGPVGIILAPTRELVDQIAGEINKFLDTFQNPFLVKAVRDRMTYQGTPRFHKVIAITGGTARIDQKLPIERGVDVIVATPGRLIDFLINGVVTSERLSYLVFDEADRMLSLNLEEQLRKIVSMLLIHPRQTLLFSATMPASVERLARTAVMNPIKVVVGEVGDLAHSVSQNVIFVHTYQKKYKLVDVLRTIPRPPVMVFCNLHQTVDKVVQHLKAEQFHAAGIHSLKTQNFRFRALRAFREGALDVLVCSDLLSRGIDVVEVEHVLLYDMPDTIEDYVHRAGRTGRFGRVGACTAFLTYDCKIARQLKKLLIKSKQPIPPELEDLKSFGGDVVKTEFGDIPKNRYYGGVRS